MRVAGNNPGYRFALMRHNLEHGGKWEPTEHGFDLPSVTTIIKSTLGVPAGAMSWYGFRLGMAGVADLLSLPDAAAEALDHAEAEYLEGMLKQRGVSPNLSLSSASDRGQAAHHVLELLAEGCGPEARHAADADESEFGTKYGQAVLDWWAAQNFEPQKEAGDIYSIVSERPVWSLKHQYSGTLDLAIHWEPQVIGVDDGVWEILDLKTHKPASGFTKPGQGAAYISDIIQIRAYREAWEEMGYGKTIGQRVVIARENGKWLEDRREAPLSLFLALRQAYELLQQGAQ